MIYDTSLFIGTFTGAVPLDQVTSVCNNREVEEPPRRHLSSYVRSNVLSKTKHP